MADKKKLKQKNKKDSTNFFKRTFGKIKDFFKYKKKEKLPNKRIKSGMFYVFQYKAETPIKELGAYDKTPLVLVLNDDLKLKKGDGVNCISWNWVDQSVRKDALNYLLKKSGNKNPKKDLIKGKPIKYAYSDIKGDSKADKYFRYAIRSYYIDSKHMKNLHKIDGADFFENVQYSEKTITGSTKSASQMVRKYRAHLNS